MSEPRIGEHWSHFKGGIYVIEGMAIHTETGEKLVIYSSLTDERKTWARPLSIFTGTVNSKPRFQRVF